MAKLRFRKVKDGDDGKLYFSQVWKESDWPLLFALRVEYWEEYRESERPNGHMYTCELLAVSPEAAGEEGLRRASEGMDIPLDDIKSWPVEVQSELLIDYGIYVCLHSESGNNLRSVIAATRKEARLKEFLFGFAMDRPVNAIGASGWDAIRGDLLAPFHRQEEDSE